MAFQFPAAPSLGQVYNAAPGIQYTWNGTGWAPTTAVANVAEGLFPDGTLAAPAISWLNEPSMGFYRDAASSMWAVVNGALVTHWTPGAFGLPAGVQANFDTVNVGGAINCSNINSSGNLVASSIYPSGSAAARWWQRSDAVFLEMGASNYWHWDKAGNYLSWNSGGGGISIAPGGMLMTTGNLHVGGMNRMSLAFSGGIRDLNFTDDGWRLRWDGGVLQYMFQAGIHCRFDGSGNIFANGVLYPNGGIRIPNDFSNGLIFEGQSGKPYTVAMCNPAIGANFTLNITHQGGVWAGFQFYVGGSEYRFTNGGSPEKNSGAGQWNGISDIRLKTNVRPLPYGLDAVTKLEPIVFTLPHLDNIYGNPERVGLSAQDAEKVMPEMVYRQADEKLGEVLGLRPDYVQYALVNAVKELDARFKALESLSLAEMSARVKLLERRLT